jgi:hypothetical protein
MRVMPYGHGVTLGLEDEPTVVAIFKNNDGTYRIQNAKNQIGSFTNLPNIGNPTNCLVVGQDGNLTAYNWEKGLNGLPCGLGSGPDQNNYKFQFTKVTLTDQNNIPAQLVDGEYYIEIKDSNTCLSFDGSISNFGGTGNCGTLTPRFGVDTSYRWILRNEPNGGFSLQNKVNGKYIQTPIFGQSISLNTNKSILNIFINSDNSLRITSTDQNPICLINDGTLKGYNWNVNNLECGTGPNATINSYKFNFVPVPPTVIPPVSDLPNGEGIYEINTGTSEGVLFEQTTGGGIQQIQPGCTVSCPIVTNSIPNIIEMSGKFGPTNLSQQRWKISKAIDDNGNKGYTFQNIFSNRYLALSNDFSQILTTVPDKAVLFLYINSDGSFTIQNQKGACLYRTQQKYADTLFGGDRWNYFYTTNRWNYSTNACGLVTPSNEVKFFLNFINPPPVIQELNGYGGNCTYNWYNPDLSTTSVSGFADEISCNTAITVAQQNAISYNKNTNDVNGIWKPFFDDGEAHILYTYGGKCISVDDNGNIIASTTCTKNNPNTQTCTNIGNTIQCSTSPNVNQPWYWTIISEKNSSGLRTGNYFIINQKTGKYLKVPENSSTATLTTTDISTPVGVKLTYPTFGNQLNGNTNILKPTSYYFHFTSPTVDQTCFYNGGSNSQAISWGINTGLVSGIQIAPLEQQQRNILYECGMDPTKISTFDPVYSVPNPNYQFTVNGYCLKDLRDNYNDICFRDDGSLL